MIVTEVAGAAADRLERGFTRIKKSLTFLNDTEIWKDFNENLVSVGNIILHLIGNVSQHILSGLGGQLFARHRDREFKDKPTLSKDELLSRLSDTAEKAVKIIRGLAIEDLQRSYSIQGTQFTGIVDIVAVLEHFSYHVGQIVFAAKLLKNVPLGL
jgi:hypothetical protein